jgi:hypothetical protein
VTENHFITFRVNEPQFIATLHLLYDSFTSTRGTATMATLEIDQPFRPTGTKVLGPTLTGMLQHTPIHVFAYSGVQCVIAAQYHVDMPAHSLVNTIAEPQRRQR